MNKNITGYQFTISHSPNDFSYDFRIGHVTHTTLDDVPAAVEPFDFKLVGAGESIPVAAKMDRDDLQRLADCLGQAGFFPEIMETRLKNVEADIAHLKASHPFESN